MSTTPTSPLDLLKSAFQWEVAAELNDDSSLKPEHESRINSLSPHAIRLLGWAQHNIVSLNPELARDLLVRPYTRRGLDVIGLGGTSTVIKIGDEVMKIMWTTRNQTAEQQQETVDELESDQQVTVNHLDEFVLAQTFDITPYPLKPSTDVVVARQPFIQDFTPLPVHDTEKLANLSRDQKAKLNDFTLRALVMADEDGSIPDLAGDDNIGFMRDDTELVLIDTLPKFEKREPDMYLRSVKHMQNIARVANNTRYL